MGTQQGFRDVGACRLQERVPLDEHLFPVGEDARLAKPARARHTKLHTRAQHLLQVSAYTKERCLTPTPRQIQPN